MSSVQISYNVDISLGTVFGQLENFLFKSLSKSRHYCGSSGKDNIIVEIDLKVAIAFLNRLESNMSNTFLVDANHAGIEDNFCS
jgi:hypothetical protein